MPNEFLTTSLRYYAEKDDKVFFPKGRWWRKLCKGIMFRYQIHMFLSTKAKLVSVVDEKGVHLLWEQEVECVWRGDGRIVKSCWARQDGSICNTNWRSLGIDKREGYIGIKWYYRYNDNISEGLGDRMWVIWDLFFKWYEKLAIETVIGRNKLWLRNGMMRVDNWGVNL